MLLHKNTSDMLYFSRSLCLHFYKDGIPFCNWKEKRRRNRRHRKEKQLKRKKL
jgi:hypothetical protein